VLLSAQATDRGVNRATRLLFPRAPTPRQMLALGLPALEDAIRSIGLFRTKARNLHETCRILVERHGGTVPRSREALEALPGVGRKTANVVLNNAFGDPTLAVDTHVFRVANRTGLALGRTPLEVEMRLLQRVPAEFLQHAHHWLILHGRYVCQARRPLCEICPVAAWCDSAPAEYRRRGARRRPRPRLRARRSRASPPSRRGRLATPASATQARARVAPGRAPRTWRRRRRRCAVRGG
jgi:endonuclease-3